MQRALMVPSGPARQIAISRSFNPQHSEVARLLLLGRQRANRVGNDSM